MPRQSAFVAVLLVSTFIGARSAWAGPEVDRHAKSAKECTDELRKNQAALPATGESASAFFHRCWWQTAAGKPTPLLSVPGKTNATTNDAAAAKAQDVAEAKADAEKAKADADAAVAKAREETAKANAEIAKAREDEATAKEEAAKEIASARAAAAAEAAAKVQASSAAKAAKDQEAARAKADAKQREAAEADAAAKTRAAAELAAATKALDAAKEQAEKKVQAATKALDAAKAQAEDAQKAAAVGTQTDTTPTADASPASKPSDAGAPQGRPATSAAVGFEGAAPPVVAQRARGLTPRVVSFGRGRLRRVPRRLRSATFESVAGPVRVPPGTQVTLSRPPAESPVVSMVKVHIQGLPKPIMWPVFPEFVPAFREFANHPIVPGFTSAP